jgi:hypothetical protein
VDENSEIQEVLFAHQMKFPNSKSEMDGFLERLTQENSKVILDIVQKIQQA